MVINSKIIPIILSIIALLILGVERNYAFTLDLLRAGWNKSEVTVLIIDSEHVTQDAIEDIEEAMDDWNDALMDIDDAPTLTLVSDVKRADIVVQIKIDGRAILGQTLTRTIGRSSCALRGAFIKLNGEVFGQEFSGAGIRNVARHEFGHALGLGHCDDPNDIMYATFECQDVFGDYDIPISGYDIDGIDAVYPPQRNCPIPDSIFWEEW